MKNCLTCGAMVADNADVCPDCGMEMDSATTPAAPAASPYSALTPVAEAPSGYTVDFGFETPASASESSAPVASSDAGDANSFGGAGGTVVLDPIGATPVAPTAQAVEPPPAVPTIAAKITLKRGGVMTGESFIFGPGSIVGRFDPDSGPVEVDLGPLPESSYVSRHHVEFRYDAGLNAWFVKDLGSRNGTFWRAGGQGAFSRLSAEQALTSGDEIALGNARFEFQTL